MRNVLYLVVGASGSGKDYIVDKICKEMHMTRCISRTTRPKRDENDKHIFVTSEQATMEIPKSVAYSNYNKHHYYVLPEDIIPVDFYIVDVKGVTSLKAQIIVNQMLIDSDMELEVLFIDAPWYVRFKNMRKRGDKLFSILRRLCIDRKEFRGFRGDYNFNSSDMLYHHFKVMEMYNESIRRYQRIREFYNVYNEEKE